MRADLAKVYALILFAHVDLYTEPPGVVRDQTSGYAGGNIPFIELAVPMAREWIIVGGYKPLDRLTIDGDAIVRAAIPVMVMIDEIE